VYKSAHDDDWHVDRWWGGEGSDKLPPDQGVLTGTNNNNERRRTCPFLGPLDFKVFLQLLPQFLSRARNLTVKFDPAK
jgi:hypothetical protein